MMGKLADMTDAELEEALAATIKTVGADSQSVRILKREVQRRAQAGGRDEAGRSPQQRGRGDE